MSVKVRLRANGDGGAYMCPCGDVHAFDGKWKFDGNVEAPTLHPSMMVRSGHYCTGQQGQPCWCTYRKEHPEENLHESISCYVCHSFVRNGVVEFLGDCTHKLANQKVPIPDWPYG